MVGRVEHASFADFAETSKRVSRQARSLGLVVPSFRTPPRTAASARTLRRRRDGGVEIAVRVHGRSVVDVVADIVEGVIAANELTGDGAIRVRTTLLAAATTGTWTGAA
jgi:hypothetical protein